MQIDFHHAVTYVAARLANFDHDQAAIIAHCAQYVDDATDGGVIEFTNGAKYVRTSSAHKMLDYRNFEALANHLVWIPFHFLPGNGGMPPGEDPPGTFIDKLRCLPDSPVARDMLRSCIEARTRRWGLHRLGITMHVYADTWAHQGFAGVNHVINEAHELTGADGMPDKSLLDRLLGYFIGGALPLGHGAVLSNPDRPWLKWGYTDGRGRKIVRDNPTDFVNAADAMCRAMWRFRLGDADAEVPGLPERDREIVDRLIRSVQDPDGERRHAIWCEAIAEGAFSFGRARIAYVAKGPGSWKRAAFGPQSRLDDDEYVYDPKFLVSDWKMFHDALQEHRFEVVHAILPRYGISTA